MYTQQMNNPKFLHKQYKVLFARPKIYSEGAFWISGRGSGVGQSVVR